MPTKNRMINAMWFETDCPNCDNTYRWHREHKNLCPQCGNDFGYIIDLSRGIDELRDFLPKD